MSVAQGVHDDALHGVVALVGAERGVALQEVLQQLVELGRQVADQLVGEGGRREVHVGDDQVAEEREQRVGAEGARPVRDQVLDERLLRRQDGGAVRGPPRAVLAVGAGG